jgi:hypothetical protein
MDITRIEGPTGRQIALKPVGHQGPTLGPTRQPPRESPGQGGSTRGQPNQPCVDSSQPSTWCFLVSSWSISEVLTPSPEVVLGHLILILFSENKHDEKSPLMRALYYYDPNAIWTDEIRARTNNLWRKQDWRTELWLTIDLRASREDLQDTWIVLANRSKTRSRSEK